METNPRISPPDDFPYPCTAAYGRDRYGIWQTVEVAGVGQTFRWIPPGSFRMGSPVGEVGRISNELQRDVTLTFGFWLADTTCTQAFWTALMGDNPSEHKGAERPVEQVSFDAVGGFLERWNEQNPGFLVRLPREAEWEYACRAGTTTPFSFGETVTTDQVNFDGDDPYLENDAKGENWNQIVPVKSLPANSWGLYEMHGNVWEWCADWYDDYDPEDTMNPRGPEVGGLRVVRGGSYWNGARRCRSAARFRILPGNAWINQGFRLASGP